MGRQQCRIQPTAPLDGILASDVWHPNLVDVSHANPCDAVGSHDVLGGSECALKNGPESLVGLVIDRLHNQILGARHNRDGSVSDGEPNSLDGPGLLRGGTQSEGNLELLVLVGLDDPFADCRWKGIAERSLGRDWELPYGR